MSDDAPTPEELDSMEAACDLMIGAELIFGATILLLVAEVRRLRGECVTLKEALTATADHLEALVDAAIFERDDLGDLFDRATDQVTSARRALSVSSPPNQEDTK